MGFEKSASFFFAAFLSSNLSMGLDTTTTLTEQKSNNTSASSSFRTLANGDIAPGNVSKVSVKKLLPSNYQGKVLAHWMPWWKCTTTPCNGVHSSDTKVEVGYSTEDASQVDKILEDMISRGYDGVMVAQSNSGDVDTASTLVMAGEMPKYPNFYFSIQENGLSSISSASGQLSQLKSDMAFADTHYFRLKNYLRMNGRPVVYVFDDGSIDWETASAAVEGNPIFILDGPNHATSTVGGFFWFGSSPHYTAVSSATEISQLDSFYSSVAAHPGRLYSGSFFKGFNDVYAPWGLGRSIDQACGQTFVNSLAAVSKYLSSSPNDLPLLQVATWDDYEEGTEVETGIDNCGSVTAKVSGTVVTPVPTFTGVGSTATVDHYVVYLSTDGENLMNAGEVAVGGSLDVGKLGIAGGTYKAYVQMVGVSHILNQMSPVFNVPVGNGKDSSSITISSPAQDSTVSNPVTLTLATHESFAVARIQVWDGQTKIVDVPNVTSMSAQLPKLSAGSHNLTINIQDSSFKDLDTTSLSFQVK